MDKKCEVCMKWKNTRYFLNDDDRIGWGECFDCATKSVYNNCAIKFKIKYKKSYKIKDFAVIDRCLEKGHKIRCINCGQRKYIKKPIILIVTRAVKTSCCIDCESEAKKKLKTWKTPSNQQMYRRVNDPIFKLKHNISVSFKNAFKQNSKIGRYVNYLGCTIPELKSYLESKFKPGMTWENHGLYGWHIDHILPKSYFDHTLEEEISECWHYTNLQPLWAKDNLSKRDTILKENK